NKEVKKEEVKKMTMKQKILEALETAKTELTKISQTKNPKRRKRALNALQQAMEISDWLKKPYFDERGYHIAHTIRQAFFWCFAQKPNRYRTHYISLGLEKFPRKGHWVDERHYAIKITSHKTAEFTRCYPNLTPATYYTD
ncbi:MAG: hypothetical protein KIH09_15165, partial [Candidatus Freyarchaeota archaeon]|nr:hypothetical protein [Candidatus Jordarchaeia archaeon]